MSKATVSTPLGAEGFDFIDGEEIRLADDPALCARQVASLMQDGRRLVELGIAARHGVESHYGLANLQTALRGALGDMLR